MKFKSTIKSKKKLKEEQQVYLELDDSLIDLKYLEQMSMESDSNTSEEMYHEI